MNIGDIVKALDAEILTENCNKDTGISGCYVCDLLSLAMSRVQSGFAWITVQTNVNIAAIAVLTEAACVIVAESMHIEDSVISKANDEGVTILRTDKSAYEAAVEIGKSL